MPRTWGSPLFLSLFPPLGRCQAALSALSPLPENSYSSAETLPCVDCSLVLSREGCGPWGQPTAIFNTAESLPHLDVMPGRDEKHLYSSFYMSGSSHVSFGQTAPCEADFNHPAFQERAVWLNHVLEVLWPQRNRGARFEPRSASLHAPLPLTTLLPACKEIEFRSRWSCLDAGSWLRRSVPSITG